MIAYCGLDCETCDAYIATQKNDDTMRRRVAEEWSKMYQADIPPEGINCTGCKSQGVKVYYCDQLCEIRKCVQRKALSHCSECGDYPCSLLAPIFKAVPQAKERLDSFRVD